jgi:hypothetical protein
VMCARNIACEARESMPGNKAFLWFLDGWLFGFFVTLY